MEKRIRYFIWAVTTMIVALFLRKIWRYLPFFINIWIGDFLWTVMLFWLLRSIFYTIPQKKLAIGTIFLCWCVEISQLFHTPWLDDFRNTTFGGLLLGHGFLWSDMAAYTGGILVAYFWDIYQNKN
jgi:Protein of unknown function (DUF2809)